MRTILSCALATALLFGAGCIKNIEVGNNGAGGAGGSTDTDTDTGNGGSGTAGSGGMGTGGESAGGAGASGSMILHANLGQCFSGELVEPLDHEIIHQTSDGAIQSVADFDACDPYCGLWNAVITDEAAYQPFVDIGFPEVDFTTSIVMISAGMDTATCTLDAGQSAPIVTLHNGVPHFEISYSFVDTYSPPGCTSCAAVGWSAVAVEIAIPAAAPVFCTHLDTGC